MEIKSVPLSWSADCNIIIAQSHFIKTVEDVQEILNASLGKIGWGLAFNEASGPCLIRYEGSNEQYVHEAIECARAIGAGHILVIILGPGGYPIHILDRLKNCMELCSVFCATANPVTAIVAVEGERAGLLGVMDGDSPKGVESIPDKIERKSLLRTLGYKAGV